MRKRELIGRFGRARSFGIGLATFITLGALLALSLRADGGGSAARRSPDQVFHGALVDASCHGPAGTAYVADAGWDGFSVLDTANCRVVTYNVDDLGNAGDPDDVNDSATDEVVAVSGRHLYFADTGTSTVAVIDAAALRPGRSPKEKLINVGLFPQDLAVTPNGAEVWVADTGPQTSPASPSGVSVIDAGTGAVVATVKLGGGGPRQIAFSPDGKTAYITTSQDLWVLDVSKRSIVAKIGGLQQPEGVAVSPDGDIVYVTDAGDGMVSAIDAATNRVTRMIAVGDLPWQVAFSPSGRAAYVADTDSNAVSVIDVAAGKVRDTISVAGDPDTLALTANGRYLWVGENSAGALTVISTATDNPVATVQLGTAFEPTDITIVG
jgi:YVTN family beta-propeller protein